MSTIVTIKNFKGRETLSSYAYFTIEGEMTAEVQRDGQTWTVVERNGIPKGTSDGENEAIDLIPNEKALQSIENNIKPLLLNKRYMIERPADIIAALEDFDLELVKNAGPNKKDWGGNACLAASTCLFQALLKASGFKAWELLKPGDKIETFWFPNIAFNMVCGGEHVPGTKQDIQEMFFFTMKDESIKAVFETGIEFFKRFEKNLAKAGRPTGTAKERGFAFPVDDNYEGLELIKECAGQLHLKEKEWAMGTDNAFAELQKTAVLQISNHYDMRFSKKGEKTRDELIDFNWSVVNGKNNDNFPFFITMEDPAGEKDIEAFRLMNKKYGDKIQIVLDDPAVTQMRFIIPFLAHKDPAKRAGNSVLIKLNQAGTFTETCLATGIVLGIADDNRVEKFLKARKLPDDRNEFQYVLDELKKIGINSLKEALDNIKEQGFTAFFSHRSTEGSSEFLPYMPLIYGAVSRKIWYKAGAPNGERNLQNYNPLIRAAEEMNAAGIINKVAGWRGLPDEVIKGRGIK